MMNWKECEIKGSWPNLRHYAGNLPGGTKKNKENPQNSRSPGRNKNM